MIEQITKKEFNEAIKYIKISYICGDISKSAFNELVCIVSSAYYGQKVCRLIDDFGNKIEERFDTILEKN